MDLFIVVVPVFGIQQGSFFRRIHCVSLLIQFLLFQTPLLNLQALFFILQKILGLFEFGDRCRFGDRMIVFRRLVFALQRRPSLNMLKRLIRA